MTLNVISQWVEVHTSLGSGKTVQFTIMKWSIFSSFVAFAAIILFDSKVADSVKEKDIEVRNDHF